MLLHPEPQCQDVDNLFSQISTSIFFETPIIIFAENEKIINSETFQCMVTVLLAQATGFVINWNTDKEIVPPMRPHNIVVYLDIVNFPKYNWASIMNEWGKVIDRSSKILVIDESANYAQLWLKLIYKMMFRVEATVGVLENNGSFFTWFPYEPPDCQNGTTFVRVEPPQLFPQKISGNLKGCPISAHAILNPPYVVDEERGIENKIMLTISEKLNATLNLQLIDFEDSLEKRDDFSRVLLNGEIEVGIGNFALNFLLYKVVDVVSPHSYDTIGYACPGAKPISRMVLLVHAFPLEMWGFVIGSFFAITLTCYLVGINVSTVQAVAISLGLSYGNNRCNWRNSFVILWYLTCGCIVAIYQACLFQLLKTVPRDQPIDTLEELKASNYTYYYSGPVVPGLFISYPKLKLVVGYPMKELTDGTSYGMIPISLYSYYGQNKSWYDDEYGYPKHILLDEMRVPICICFLMTFSHPLRDIFSGITSRLVEGGFPEHWKNEFMKPIFLYDKNVNTPISLQNVEGAFYVLGFLLFLSLLLFLAEYITKGKK